MPATVIPIRRTAGPPRDADLPRRATWSLLEVARPGHAPEPLGILFVDVETKQLALRLKDETDFDDLEEDEADYLGALEADLRAKGRESGGEALLNELESSLSGFLRIGDRSSIEYSGDASHLVNRLYDVDREIRPFVTHLPLYGLRAAATKFGEEFGHSEMMEPDTWLRVPRGLRLTNSMFVAQVIGRSMEPLIPDGSYCIFRGPVTGSRQGKRLLIEQTGGPGATTDLDGRYTVKRYSSQKKLNPDGTWQHDRIRLEPLNPDFDAFELGDGEFRVIGEFVQVLES
jgi:hypothetical protein